MAAALDAAPRASSPRASVRGSWQAERLDLTEVTTRPRRGHAHLVTQAWERLEDVFIGLGFQIAEGPEVETDFLQLRGAEHADRATRRAAGFDTLFTDYGEPTARCCCARTRRRCRSG